MSGVEGLSIIEVDNAFHWPDYQRAWKKRGIQHGTKMFFNAGRNHHTDILSM